MHSVGDTEGETPGTLVGEPEYLNVLYSFQVRQITPPPTNCLPFVQKADVLTPRLNICGTPSSSPVESGSKNTALRKPMCRTSLENENDLSDDSPNHSDDEAILSECIRSAMPKVRSRCFSAVRERYWER